MQLFEWLNEQRQLLLTRIRTHFVHATAAFVALSCMVWLVIPHPVIPVAIGLVPLAILITLSQPVLLGLLFIAFSFFRLHEAFAPLYNLKFPLLLSLGTLTTLAWHIGLSGKIKMWTSKELNAFYIFFALVFIGIPLSSNVGEAIAYFKNIYVKIGIMTPALAWLLTGIHHYRNAMIMITVSGTAVAIVTLFNKVNGIGMVEGTRVTVGRELGSVLGDPNDLALVLLFPFSFTISILMTPGLSKKTRFLAFLSAVAIFSAIIATQSRGGLLGIMSAVGVLAWRRVKSKTLLFIGGGITAAVLFVAAGISGRKSGGAAEEGLDASAAGRLYAWEAAFYMAVDNPLSGVGLNNFYFNYFEYSKHWDGLNHAVHSTWFGVLGETGFIGLIAFMVMTITVFVSAKRATGIVMANPVEYGPVIRAISEGLYSGIVAFCVSGTFLTQGFTWPIYILLALTASVFRYVSLREADLFEQRNRSAKQEAKDNSEPEPPPNPFIKKR
ncbi:O-antigen ligase family protein [Grimontia kaedaensis]|uniref:O-antigen ligase family protein n=1 Tax=Grimontia kaedaensis TaxID=2872157 RepID=A0ABY4X1M5_9GAMM|nr:O-antigen ligase family protein [Grimontia kaedaensis]USH05110.1 O-antigen ligase family protein [Grimontia kaedaensis]